ncbi:MAG: hypothetical protein JO316_02775 [Abitibacteriaceae bacterium]|nr:hypothetical protein [Abditibacteriaceae bacterium]MBV9864253.1 hypothetical protein [Abditibacteriaceae bacterium]
MAYWRAKWRRKITLAQSAAFAALPVPKLTNPDIIALRFLQEAGYSGFSDAPSDMQRECSIRAANLVYAQLEEILRNNGAVTVETVLSTDKYLGFFKQVAATGGIANLIYIGNQNPAISVERVAIRVRKGGHDVPVEKIHSRWHRSLQMLPLFWKIATEAWLFDYSDALSPPTLLLHKSDGRTLPYASSPNANNVLWRAIMG